MPDERISSFGERDASISAKSSDTEWHAIHAGKEIGPISLAELEEKGAAGEIEPDDLVKQTAGMWTKARDVASLQEQFRLKRVRQETLDKLGRFNGIWLSKRALVIGGCILLVVGILAAVWAIQKPITPEPVLVGKKEPAFEQKIEKKAPEAGQNDAGLHHALADAWERKGVYDEAIKHYDEAIRLDPKNTTYYQGRGLC